MKKWLCFLLAFGLMTTPVWAQDDDDEEWEEEESPKKKAAPKKAKKESSGDSRMGLAVSFTGSNGTDGRTGAVSFFYDLGGMEIGFGLGLRRFQRTPNTGDAPEAIQSITLVPSFYYALGKGLLDYGLGVDVGVILESTEAVPPDGGTSIYGFPNFYVKADLTKNVVLKLSAGILVDMPAARPATNAFVDDGYSDMTIRLGTSGSIIFYFM